VNCLALTSIHIICSPRLLFMASYSSFERDKKCFSSSSFEDTFGLLGIHHSAPQVAPLESSYAPPLTPSVGSPGSDAFGQSMFTPPSEQPNSALHALLQMALEKSATSAPPPFSNSSTPSASLLSCLPVLANRPVLNRQISQTEQGGANLTISSVSGRVLELATDRNGSRLLQKLLTQGGMEIVSKVIDEVEFNLPVVMCDTYANYMCQQLFQAASAVQRHRLLSRLSPKFVEVARDRRGTHSLQALISHISTREEEDLLALTLENEIESMALDVHATHVLQQAISCCMAKPGPARKLDFVFREVCKSLHKLAVDPNALGVVKRCITHSQIRGYAPLIAGKVEKHMFEFVENPYANYAVQHALETWSGSSDPAISKLSERLITMLLDKIAPMSLHKFASNVAEMAIKSSRGPLRHSLIEALHFDDDSRMLSLMRSPFGVFVAGTAIKFAENPAQGQALTLAVCRNLRKLPDGRNKTKWEKLLADCAYAQNLFSALAASMAVGTPSTCSDTASNASSRC
jgi:hypothetical protein